MRRLHGREEQAEAQGNDSQADLQRKIDLYDLLGHLCVHRSFDPICEITLQTVGRLGLLIVLQLGCRITELSIVIRSAEWTAGAHDLVARCHRQLAGLELATRRCRSSRLPDESTELLDFLDDQSLHRRLTSVFDRYASCVHDRVGLGTERPSSSRLLTFADGVVCHPDRGIDAERAVERFLRTDVLWWSRR